MSGGSAYIRFMTVGPWCRALPVKTDWKPALLSAAQREYKELGLYSSRC